MSIGFESPTLFSFVSTGRTSRGGTTTVSVTASGVGVRIISGTITMSSISDSSSIIIESSIISGIISTYSTAAVSSPKMSFWMTL